MRIHPATQVVRRALTALGILVLLAAAVAVVVNAKNQVSNSPPSVSCATTVRSPSNPVG